MFFFFLGLLNQPLEEVERQKGTQMLQSIKKMLFARKQI
jgi:hypothetical protein